MTDELMEKPVKQLQEEGKLDEAIAKATKQIQAQIGGQEA